MGNIKSNSKILFVIGLGAMLSLVGNAQDGSGPNQGEPEKAVCEGKGKKSTSVQEENIRGMEAVFVMVNEDSQVTCSEVQALSGTYNTVKEQSARCSRPFDGCGGTYRKEIKDLCAKAVSDDGTGAPCDCEFKLYKFARQPATDESKCKGGGNSGGGDNGGGDNGGGDSGGGDSGGDDDEEGEE